MPDKRRPRKGSLAYHPHSRASSHCGRVRSWPMRDEVGPLGFPGYKAGMTHIHMIEDRPNAPEKGREVSRAATVIDCPDLIVFGLRLYSENEYGKYAETEVWAGDLDKSLSRRIRRLPKENDPQKALAEMEEMVDSDEASDLTLLIHTAPRQTGIKKKPDIAEIGLGGETVRQKFDYAKEKPGETIPVPDVFRAGELVDVTAVTKGKGFTGPVKRWGIKLRDRKTNDARRNPGSLGPWHPHQIMWTVPLAGSGGYNQRTEFNKRIVKIGGPDDPCTPNSGFLRYGEVSNNYIILLGSVPGPSKRLINLRKSMRPKGEMPKEPPTLTAVSTASAQGK